MIITVTGPPGSGATTLAKNLSLNLGLKYVSGGAVLKKIAAQRGVTEEEIKKLALTDPTIDYEIEKVQKKAASENNVVIDAKLAAWKLQKVDLRIYVHAPKRIRAKRIAQAKKMPLAMALEKIEASEEINAKRFLAWYGINIEDVSIYDLVINTNKWKPEGVLEIVSKAIKKINKVQ